MRLIAATKNKGKLAEIKSIFSDMGFEVISQEEAGVDIDVEETGNTFLQNAILKARTVAQAADAASIADDSGLCVDALGGEPGIYSARYAGEGADSGMLMAKLLKKMENVTKEERTAHFVSVVTLYLPDGRYYSAEGRADGIITDRPCGDGGFGYDPVFFSTELNQTFAQASAEDKNKVSHRYRALTALKDAVKDIF